MKTINIEKGQHRPLSAIAEHILAQWKKPSPHAIPYIEAMLEMDNIKDDYGLDSGKSVVLYFLSNAGTWRGDMARMIKAELKAML